MRKTKAKRPKRIAGQRKRAALEKVAEYIVDCENSEYDSYVSFCEENGLKPENIKGLEQSKHVYAQALIGLGLEFPQDDSTPLDKSKWTTGQSFTPNERA